MSEQQAKYRTKGGSSFKERLYKEEEELRDKILNLNKFIISDAFITVSLNQRVLLPEQLSAMKLYHKCLSSRIKDIEEQERKEKLKDELR